MARLTIFTKKEQEKFDSPPKFNKTDQGAAFLITGQIKDLIERMHKDVNKIGFMIQLGYFNASGKFFKPDQYQGQDINYIKKMLSLTSADITIERYTTKSRLAHQKTILKLLEWSDFNSNEKLNLTNEVARHVKQQLHPKQLMHSAINYLIINKITLPSYHFMNDIITDSYNNYEYKLLNALELKLTNEHTTILDSFISKKDAPDDTPSFGLLKKLIHSLKPMAIEESVEQFESVKKYYILFKPLINELNLSQQGHCCENIFSSNNFQVALFMQPTRINS